VETVAIERVRGGQVEKAVRCAIASLGPLPKPFQPGACVLIKPNLVGAFDWRTGATTNPAVVEAIAQWAWEAGAGDVVIGDGSGHGQHTSDALRMNVYEEMARRCRARLVDLNADAVEVPCPRGKVLKSLPISRTALEADWLISVPVLKTHFQAVATLSLKNMKGILSWSGKRKLHFVGLHQAIVDLNTVMAPHLIVVDGTVGHEGLGPVTGEPVGMNLILAGTNRVAVDAVCCRVMGIDPSEVPHIMLAAAGGMGPTQPDQILVVGEAVEVVSRPFKRAEINLGEACAVPGLTVIEGATCSGCNISLALAFKEMQADGELSRIADTAGPIVFVYGEDADLGRVPQGAVVLHVGKCQRGSKRLGPWVPGCPPGLSPIKDTLREATGFQRRGLPPELWQEGFEDEGTVGS
jgi:uncharacterized protein (DUF362 family)